MAAAGTPRSSPDEVPKKTQKACKRPCCKQRHCWGVRALLFVHVVYGDPREASSLEAAIELVVVWAGRRFSASSLRVYSVCVSRMLPRMGSERLTEQWG